MHDLDEVARGVLRRQQRKCLTGSHGESGDAALVGVLAAVHVHVELDRLADAQIAELGFLEVGVDPDFGEGAKGHHALARLEIVAPVDVSPRDDAVDLGDDSAIAEIQFRLRQILFGFLKLGLGLFDGGGFFQDVGDDAVEIALRIALVEFRQGLPGSQVVRAGEDAERSGALEQVGDGLADGGKSLIEIGGHAAEIVGARRHERAHRLKRRQPAARQADGGGGQPGQIGIVRQLGLSGQSQADPRLINHLQRLFGLRFGDANVLQFEIEVLSADGAGRSREILGPIVIGLGADLPGPGGAQGGDVGLQQGDLIVHVLDGVLKLEAIAAGQRHLPAHLVRGGHQIGLRLRDVSSLEPHLNLERRFVEQNEQVPLLDAIVVVHAHVNHLAGHARRDRSDVPVHVGVVSRNRTPDQPEPRNAEIRGGHDRDEPEARQYHFSAQ